MIQFQCPQCGNILEAEAAQAGQQSQCPICGAMFIIPAPAAPEPPGGVPQFGDRPAAREPVFRPAPPTGSIPWSPIGPGGGEPAPIPELKEPESLHIPCPQCHQVLEAPLEMLDQQVLCPHCESQFTLERRNSIEFQRRCQQELELRERKAGNAWFNWAIVTVVVVLIFLLFLLLSSSGR